MWCAVEAASRTTAAVPSTAMRVHHDLDVGQPVPPVAQLGAELVAAAAPRPAGPCIVHVVGERRERRRPAP